MLRVRSFAGLAHVLAYLLVREEEVQARRSLPPQGEAQLVLVMLTVVQSPECLSGC